MSVLKNKCIQVACRRQGVFILLFRLHAAQVAQISKWTGLATFWFLSGLFSSLCPRAQHLEHI